MIWTLRVYVRGWSQRIGLGRRAATATEYAIVAAILAAALYGVVSGIGHQESNTFQSAAVPL